MTTASLSELRSLRDRLVSLEHRQERFERTALMLLKDLIPAAPLRFALATMLRTPDELVQILLDRHPDLADHPALRELKVMLVDDRQDLNQILQQDMGNAVAAIRQHLESVLHPLESDVGNPQNPLN